MQITVPRRTRDRVRATAPTRITIELQADQHSGTRRAPRWVPVSIAEGVTESPEVSWAPQPYEPGPCTCEEGWCDRDHENE